jgi:hypothetical protein
MLAGMAAGAVNTAINGGNFGYNIGMGALFGGIAGAVGPGVFEGMGGVVSDGFAWSNFVPAVKAGAVVGAALGGLNAAISGRNFFQSVAFGALGGAIVAGAQSLARYGWESAKTWTDNSSAEGDLTPLFNDRGEHVTAGMRACPTCSKGGEPRWYDMQLENSQVNRILGIEYDVNSHVGYLANQVSKFHDLFNGWAYERGNYVSMGPVLDRAFDIYSFVGMPIAAVFTSIALAPRLQFYPMFQFDKDSHAKK